ncbi:mechanosensitive ion channel domain-containing protein [uncultured Pseudodesulfovibrio sp.]|uniref:mechanosensitive ion channel family protein n=1 Tax=uncultured Pseudodesulfovibrio sp. TaxID=2035858 RepID=UPI0029C68ED9|nr:mechanosensitive ion channel domain-containing protein [uncultured Pseudodesulfovibrio sp.]
MNDFFHDPYVIKAIQSISLALVVFILTKITTAVVTRKGKRFSEASFAIKFTATCLFGITLIFIWLEGFGPILTAMTIVAAALTIVSKELLLNFLGSFVIFWRELFAIGDRVQVGESSGDVIDKGLMYFTLLEAGTPGSTGHSTGRLIKVPNALALTQPVSNATRGAGHVWHEIKIAITKESDWEEAKSILLSAIEDYYTQEKINLTRIKKEFERKRVFFKQLSPRAYLDITTGGIELTVRYICKSRMIRESRDHILSKFLHEMKQAKITLANEQLC